MQAYITVGLFAFYARFILFKLIKIVHLMLAYFCIHVIAARSILNQPAFMLPTQMKVPTDKRTTNINMETEETKIRRQS